MQTYHSDIWSKEKSLDKVPLVLFHPCVKQKLNRSIDLLLLLFNIQNQVSFWFTCIQFSLSVFRWFPRICTQTWGKQGLSVTIKLWFPSAQCFMVFKNFDFMRIRTSDSEVDRKFLLGTMISKIILRQPSYVYQVTNAWSELETYHKWNRCCKGPDLIWLVYLSTNQNPMDLYQPKLMNEQKKATIHIA